MPDMERVTQVCARSVPVTLVNNVAGGMGYWSLHFYLSQAPSLLSKAWAVGCWMLEFERAFLVQSMRQRYQLPVGAVVHPLADPQDVPVIGLDHGGIVRCKRCRTYINPFVRWSDGGRWACHPTAWALASSKLPA